MKNQIKEEILNRLYKSSSHCTFCGRKGCGHQGNRRLPMTIKTEDVLRAINLNEFYEVEE